MSYAIIHVPSLLTKEELVAIDHLIAGMSFEDGKSTATGAAKEVKFNRQSSRTEGGEALAQAREIITHAIMTSPLIQTAMMPKYIIPPIISQYGEGMHYGWHTDSPLMAGEHVIRVDLSMTLFLSEPEQYQGGELVIDTPNGNVFYKLNKGDAVIYPTTKLHCVNQVQQGTRTAAVTWMQSMVRDTEQRELLFQLKTVQELINNKGTQSPENLLLMQAHSNLLRMWADV